MAKGKTSGGVQRLDTKYFSEAITQLDSAVSDFKAALSNINRATERLQASWDGKGADKFDSAYSRLKKEFDDQADTLTAIKDDLQVILETYEEWDATTKSDLAGETKE